MRPAMRTDTSEETADRMPAAKNTDPRDSMDMPNRPKTQTAKIAWVANPPPRESRLNNAERRSTVRLEAALSACRTGGPTRDKCGGIACRVGRRPPKLRKSNEP